MSKTQKKNGMLETFKAAWSDAKIKNKLLFTLLIIILYRVGSAIPVPYFEYSATLASTQRSQTVFSVS